MKWTDSIIKLLLLALVMLLQWRVYETNKRIDYLTDELIKTKQQVLEEAQKVGEFMKSTNDFTHATNETIRFVDQAINNHTKSITILASGGAR